MAEYLSLLEHEAYVDHAIDSLGLTHNLSECAYVLRDGRMLANGDIGFLAESVSEFTSLIGAIAFGQACRLSSPPSPKQIARIIETKRPIEIIEGDEVVARHEQTSVANTVSFFTNHYGAEAITEGKLKNTVWGAGAGLGLAMTMANTGPDNSKSFDDIQREIATSNMPEIVMQQGGVPQDFNQVERQPEQQPMATPPAKQPWEVGDPTQSDDPQLIMALTMWGEARSHGEAGMRAVGHVILNRANSGHPRRFGRGVVGVSKKRKQFSCWNRGDPNLRKMQHVNKIRDSHPTSYGRFVQAYRIAGEILNGQSKDPTKGAVYYHTDDIDPYWASSVNKVGKHANHIFYTL